MSRWYDGVIYFRDTSCGSLYENGKIDLRNFGVNVTGDFWIYARALDPHEGTFTALFSSCGEVVFDHEPTWKS